MRPQNFEIVLDVGYTLLYSDGMATGGEILALLPRVYDLDLYGGKRV